MAQNFHQVPGINPELIALFLSQEYSSLGAAQVFAKGNMCCKVLMVLHDVASSPSIITTH